MKTLGHKPNVDKIRHIYQRPLLELVFEAAKTHSEHHNPYEIKASRLISVKTGNCVENCAYCAQSSRYNTGLGKPKILSKAEVKVLALKAKEEGIKRVCLSASYKNIPEGKSFEDILNMIKTVKDMELDVCLTMGKVSGVQAKALAKAGIKAYNHNIDTSEAFYSNIITSRTFKERIETLNILMDNNVNVCSGGIIGMGENEEDRIQMLFTLTTLKKQPYTVPLNVLVPISGTPLENIKRIDDLEMVRIIATLRIILPETNICLAAGRHTMHEGTQALCFMAGANAVFTGDKLLTTPNAPPEKDIEMFKKLGLKLI
ncbi:MAG: biotin synthase BioB [Bacteroidales bacterium]|nr:biotin synthase BioB [Bacteroidales bacterium]